MAVRARSEGQARGDDRQRRQRDADRSRNSEHRQIAHHLSALGALGIAQSAISPDDTAAVALPDARGAAVPAMVSPAPGMDFWRSAPSGPAEGSKLARGAEVIEQNQRLASGVLYPLYRIGTRRAYRSARKGPPRLSAVRQADAAGQRVVPDAAQRTREARVRSHSRDKARWSSHQGWHRVSGRCIGDGDRVR